MKKIKAHSIGGKVLKWIENWLQHITQRVVLYGSSSIWKKVLSGVSQDSLLGSLLFVIFINDIDETVECVKIIKKFADDTKVGHIVMNPTDSETLQTALNNLSSWADLCRMRFNTDKCKVMHMGKKKF